MIEILMRILRLNVQRLIGPINFFAVAVLTIGTELPSSAQGTYGQWKNGPRGEADFFPIGVWLQSPKNAPRYKAAGINLYVGLWQGPTEAQLHALKAAGMPVICAQNSLGLAQKDNPMIVGWMHGDEPDNAQAIRGQKGYGPPILPQDIVANYEKMRAADPTRPVVLNLGQGVAWDNYIGRGVRRNHPKDYAEYVKGCDIPSFDIYPAVHSDPAIAGKLEYVAHGVERLARWAGSAKPVWNCIECTRISNTETKPTPQQVRSEVWMSIIHGSRGIIYFVHQFKPAFQEAALLEDQEMLGAVTAINREIKEFAPVLNSATITNGVEVQATAAGGLIALLTKRHGGATYPFTANMRNQPTRAQFTLSDRGNTLVELLDQGRRLAMRKNTFTDEFPPYAVHQYRIPDANLRPTGVSGKE
jgi:hypothetical protein